MDTFTFEVHTPYRLFFSGRVENFILTLSDGEVCVYAHHSFFIAPVISCILRIKDEKGKLINAFVTEGILEVKDFKTVLMVETAEWPEEIDAERALASKQKAEDTINNSQLKFEIDKAIVKLRRSEFRLKAAELKC